MLVGKTRRDRNTLSCPTCIVFFFVLQLFRPMAFCVQRVWSKPPSPNSPNHPRGSLPRNTQYRLAWNLLFPFLSYDQRRLQRRTVTSTLLSLCFFALSYSATECITKMFKKKKKPACRRELACGLRAEWQLAPHTWRLFLSQGTAWPAARDVFQCHVSSLLQSRWLESASTPLLVSLHFLSSSIVMTDDTAHIKDEKS